MSSHLLLLSCLTISPPIICINTAYSTLRLTPQANIAMYIAHYSHHLSPSLIHDTPRVMQHGSVSFHPPLPDTKTTAISQLAMGVLNKVRKLTPTLECPRAHHKSYDTDPLACCASHPVPCCLWQCDTTRQQHAQCAACVFL